MVLSCFAQHGVRQAPLRVQPGIGARQQIRDGMSTKELGPDAFARRFIRDGLGSVFAKLRARRRLGIGPGTARAIKPRGLVHRAEHAQRATHPCFTENVPRRRHDGGHAAGSLRRNLEHGLARLQRRRRLSAGWPDGGAGRGCGRMGWYVTGWAHHRSRMTRERRVA
jgi:hypothetical protein